LVVDDEEDMRKLMAELVKEAFAGSEVLTAPNAEQALESLKRHAADVVVSDFRMPGMDGIEFLILVAEHIPPPARILVTAYASSDLAARAKEAGIQAFVGKGEGPEALLAAIRDVLASLRNA
jgi:CheY-like chemotaxis protein